MRVEMAEPHLLGGEVLERGSGYRQVCCRRNIRPGTDLVPVRSLCWDELCDVAEVCYQCLKWGTSR